MTNNFKLTIVCNDRPIVWDYDLSIFVIPFQSKFITERTYDKNKFDRIYKKHYRKKTFKCFHLWYEKIYANINSAFIQKQINASYDKLFSDK